MTNLVYEEQQVLHDYLLFHYGNKEQILSTSFPVEWALNFPEKCITENLPQGIKGSRALDIGCSVGRSSFELSKHFDEVVGIDFSHSFINAAKELQTAGSLDISIKDHGHRFIQNSIKLPKDAHPERVTFLQGDACDLPESSEKWDLVLAANLLCRLPKPRKFLSDITLQIKSGGYFILVSPYTWMEEYTDINEWIGGTPETGDSKETVKDILKTSFNLIQEKEIPFLIREHSRKYQLSTSHATVWEKR